MLVPLQSSNVFASLTAAAPAKEAETLLKWKASLDNKSQTLLSSWLGDSHCNWLGITCDEVGSITNLTLPNYEEGLIGLNLSGNKLNGSIPASIGSLHNLMQLVLGNNSLSGHVPGEVGMLRNKLGESIPFSLSYIYGLQSLDLSQNLLVGAIPQQLGKLQTLEILDLSHNMLNGSIPIAFNGLQSLTIVNLSYNQLEGPIPNLKAFHEASFDALRNNKGLCGNATG
ncbi:hypothetical protein POUND7_008489 [Theobroma cacao]